MKSSLFLLLRILVVFIGLSQTIGVATLPSKSDNRPLFEDGRGYYSYVKPIDISFPKDGKILLHYFFQYECPICSFANDTIMRYVENNQNKVVLEKSPAFPNGNIVHSRFYQGFLAINRPELSELYLYDSSNRNPKKSLVNDEKSIVKWLRQKEIDPTQFDLLLGSEKIKQSIEQDYQTYMRYSPPYIPLLILNGKYILAADTLKDDDYTVAVLDFLIDKLQKEQKEVKK